MNDVSCQVKLLSMTSDAQSLIYSAFRQCYFKGFVGDNWEKYLLENKEAQIKLIEDTVKSGHTSPIEHVSFSFAISGISRSLSHQLVRHRIASYCVSKNTKISTSSQKTNNRTIEELFHTPDQYRSMLKIKCIDEQNGDINYHPCKSIIYSGKKHLYRVKTKHGYSIDTTMEHRFHTVNGWKQLKELSIGSYVYINGEPLHQNKDWLHHKYHIENLSQEYIGQLCGASEHTVRKWIRRHQLQKPLGSWTKGVFPHNKGKTKENYSPLMQTSIKMRHNTNSTNGFYENNSNWKGLNITSNGGYSRTHRYYQYTGKCELCGTTEFLTELHHKDKNPINCESDNIQELCTMCHKIVHGKHIREHVLLSEITSIEYVGIDDTYDIEMHPPHHNFIANGFVVHNSQQSQRYCDASNIDCIIPPAIKNNPKTLEEFNKLMDVIQDTYIFFIQNNIKAEDARYVLPHAAETKIVVTMNCRSLLNFFEHRCCTRAQWEIRHMANQMLSICREKLPVVFNTAGARCEKLEYCPEGEKFTCGRYPLQK